MLPAIHQLVAGFRQGDAISNQALLFRRVFRDWGHAAAIACPLARVSPQARAEVRDLAALVPTLAARDIVLLHLSIGSPVNAAFARLPCRKAILYHNITPSSYFRLFNPAIAAELEAGRAQAAALAGSAEVNLAVSAFNAAELRDWGYAAVGVLPLAIDLESLDVRHADPLLSRRLDDGCPNVLFVGRCVPNKKIEELLTVMHYVQRHVEPAARFVHVGSFAGAEAYYSLLLARVQSLGLRDVRFLGSVTQAELNACYRRAAIFLCLSEHEGFGAPLIEAMLHDVPVIAAAHAAIPETLDGAGVLLRSSDPRLAAEMVGRLLHDAPLRQAVIARQRRRLAACRARDLSSDLRHALAPLLATTPPGAHP